ncbi:MAG: DUF6311 domain-containing protein [Gammaproteobacteria bacterium]|nr:DUF6311 domain-containing protein [Gammaproteobacteria bacterium]
MLSLGLAAALGLVLALVVYPPHFLLGDAARFHNFVFPNDAIDYRLAWQALVDRGRPWPSLWTDLFNYPHGFPISLLDALPLAATVFRPFVSWLPADFHYIGLWHAIAVTFQAVAGAILARAAGVRHVLPCLAVAAFAVAMPIFVGRLNWTHVALSTQGLLILALALCIYTSRARASLSFVLPRAAVLSLVSLAVHPLLALQVLFFCMIATALSGTSDARGRRGMFLRASAVVALCMLFAALCHALGIFAAQSFLAEQGLGSFGFSPWGMLVGEPDSLRQLYQAPGPGLEQDAWLGWGCVLLLAAGFAFRPRFRISRTYYPLAGAMALLAIAAVSPWVRIGTRLIDLSPFFPDVIIDLYAIHRAMVRLAWPLVICLSLLPLLHFAAKWPRTRALAVLGAAFALQLYSISPYWAHEYTDARVAVTHLEPLPATLEGGSVLVFREQPREPDVVTVYPRYAMYLAVESGLPLTGGGFSRPPPSDPGGPDSADLFSNGARVRYLVPAVDYPIGLPRLPVTCIEWEVLVVCRAEGPKQNMIQPLTGPSHE